jgi:nitrite reductase/ring-hydroxylating ferredoxin subunit/uncharacterized membrane protein
MAGMTPTDGVRRDDGAAGAGAVSAAEEAIVRAIEGQVWTDRVAEPVQRPVYALLEQQGVLRTLLDGSWLGHPVHPAVTDVPVGAWTTGMMFDLADLLGIGGADGRRGLRGAADAIQAIGLAGALGAALFGLADWTYTAGRARRVGTVHGLLNLGVAGLYGTSLVARSQDRRGLGIALSGAGYLLLLLSTWLGGELTFRYGLGVNRAAFEEPPAEWTPVLDAPELAEGQLLRVEVQGTPVMLARRNGRVVALADTCTHMGCSLAGGRLDGDEVVCPCHGSRFRLDDGQVVSGPATTPEPVYEVRVRDGRIEVRQPVTAYGEASVR